jgi:hypothetical protein
MGIFRQRESLESSPVAEAQSDSRGVNLMIGLITVAFFFLLEVLSWFTERGGVFSVLSALLSVPSKPPVLDIDKDGLLFPTVVIVWLTGVGLSRLFAIRFDMSKRGKAFLPILAIIGSGFFLNAAYGESIITRYMTAHGYNRCEDGDWEQGNGKSRVWFADYVRQDIECRRRKNTVPEFSPFG